MKDHIHNIYITLINSPLKARLAKGAFWGFTGSAIARGLALISSFFIARMLGRDGFGEWGIIQSTIGMVGVLSGFGLGLTSTKYIAEYKSQDLIQTGRIIGLSSIITGSIGLGMSILFWILAPLIATRVLNAPNLLTSIRIGTFLLFFTAFDESQKGALAGFEEFQLITKIVLWTGVLSFPLTIAGVYWGGLNGGVGALALNSLLTWLLNWIAIRKVAEKSGLRVIFRNCWQERAIIWKFSIPAFISQSIIIPMSWLCSTILAHQPGGYFELGLFNAANQWRGALLFLPYTAGRIILPVLTDLHSTSETLTLRRTFRIISLVFIGIGIFGFLGISFLSKYILKGYGPEFIGGEIVVIILGLSALGSTALFICNQLLYSTNKIWYSVFSNVLVSIIMLISALYFIPRYGALGLALTFAISSISEAIWKFIFIRTNKWV